MKTIVTLLVLLSAPLAHAQDPMAKWKPNVGDVFHYTFTSAYSESISGAQTYTVDTLEERVIGVSDSADSLLYSSVVVHDTTNKNSFLHGDFVYEFRKSQPLCSKYSSYPFSISGGNFFCAGPFNFSCSESDSIRLVGGIQDTILKASFSNEDHSYGYSATSCEARYSLALRWFVTKHASSYIERGIHDVTSTVMNWSLFMYERASQSVRNSKFSSLIGFINSNDVIYLTNSEAMDNSLTLLDPLGRPIRSWQLAASDGPREITLNVSDVPSGVYFLRLSGNGMDEIKRVAIIH